ncbi:hypothetical protein RRG08_045998 [Elysia crispata]|uniref:Secreted protein n=1 Tax=Elysia crispata TaxID=231223 RepID=A0AAE1D7M3_9GAST|nr:hypothetical protein RRG08_045998 [Elysia crispata]
MHVPSLVPAMILALHAPGEARVGALAEDWWGKPPALKVYQTCVTLKVAAHVFSNQLQYDIFPLHLNGFCSNTKRSQCIGL